MARGDMLFESVSIGGQVEILNRTPFEGVPMTIDFASNYSTDSDTGEKYMPAGMPIDKDGRAVKTTPFSGAVGILLHDVYESRPQGTILKKAYINTKRAQTNSGATYDAALVAAMVNAGCRIVFESPVVSGTIPATAGS